MNVNSIFQQKLQEIQSRVPIHIMKNTPSNAAGNDFGTIFHAAVNQLDLSKSEALTQGKTPADLVSFAKGYINVPYVWGGTTPKGFDCSGFTKYVMNEYGIDIRRVSQDQAKDGTYVPKEDLSVGDLVFFDTKGKGISHVGIYIGSGEFIHASSASKKVTISSLEEGFYADTYVTARKVLLK
ncbi:MAG: cell wall-associated hydrolase, invasion-associated protein [Anaerosolibacter sp.]|uniref:C40 family peptidase n=1 Tax=Anaerosolibacter sp. TaxID=1872527 RepID=UPI00261DFCCC|nr:C40 family peptidase [Anaerosolibacter sp.]MDF2547310.1 cell wall-associated hydrolase, invasion-associated protein [Anaerosolibacter sp.]